MQTQPQAESHPSGNVLLWVVAALPVLAAYLVLAVLWTNLPVLDDYWHLIAFALAFHAVPTEGLRLHLLLTTQVGPYKLLLDHAIVAAELLLLGRLYFPLLILLGNLTPLGILYMVWKRSPRRETSGWQGPLLVFLPLAALVFNLNYAETLDWAISGLQQPLVILFSFAAFFFLSRSRRRWDFVWAWTAALLATATYANGVLVWPVGLLYLLIETRRWARLVAWSAGFALSAGFYLYHYVSDGQPLLSHIGGKALFPLLFSGGAMENMHHRPIPYLSAVIGLGVFVTFVHALWTRFDRRNPFQMYATGWVLLTAVVVANARTGMGLALSLSSRYKIYSDLLIAFCFVYLLDRTWAADKAKTNPTHKAKTNPTHNAKTNPTQAPLLVRWAVVAAVLLAIGGDFAGARLLAKRRVGVREAMAAYLHDPAHNSPLYLPDGAPSPEERAVQDQARRELNQAVAAGIYRLPERR